MATKSNRLKKITRTIGHEIVDGKKVGIKKQFYGKTKKEAQRKYEEWLVGNAKLKEKVLASNRPVGQLMDYWKDNVFMESSKYASTTKTRYTGAYERFKKADKTKLLKKPAQDVDANDIQNAYKGFKTSMSTLETLNKFFRAFLKWAIINKYCTDFLEGVELPRKPKKIQSTKITTWDKNTLSRLLKTSEGHRFRIFIVLAAYSGLRPGEIMGLEYGDIYDGVIHVRRQWTDENEFSEPKWGSARDIPMVDIVREEIYMHREWHKKEKHCVKNDLIFTTTIGTPYNHKSFRDQFRKLCEKNGIEYKTPRSLRATYCTYLFRSGVPVETASLLMGHKSVETTMRHYLDIGMEDKKDATDKLEKWLKSS